MQVPCQTLAFPLDRSAPQQLSTPSSHSILWEIGHADVHARNGQHRSMLSPFRVLFRLRDFQYCIRSVAFGGKCASCKKGTADAWICKESQP